MRSGQFAAGILIPVLALFLFSAAPGRKNYIRQEVERDHKIFLYFSKQENLLDSFCSFTYEVHGTHSSFVFYPKGKASKPLITVRMLFSDTLERIAFEKDSCLWNKTIPASEIGDSVISQLKATALRYKRIFTEADCGYSDCPRLGMGLVYYSDEQKPGTNRYTQINKHWYYSSDRWEGSEKKYFLKTLSETFSLNDTVH